MPRDKQLPVLSFTQEGVKIHASITSTDAQIANQGYTFNQAGFTFNQAGEQFGGIYLQGQDITPIITVINRETPHIDGFTDLGFSPGGRPRSTGVGWWMYVTQ